MQLLRNIVNSGNSLNLDWFKEFYMLLIKNYIACIGTFGLIFIYKFNSIKYVNLEEKGNGKCLI